MLALASQRSLGRHRFNVAVLNALVPGIKGWISGKPLNEIERALGGDPDDKSETAKMCPQARELIATFIPRGLSFVMGLISRMAEEMDAAGAQEDLDESTLQSLTTAVGRGFDTVGKLEFANTRRDILGRVQLHKIYDERRQIVDLDFEDDL